MTRSAKRELGFFLDSDELLYRTHKPRISQPFTPLSFAFPTLGTGPPDGGTARTAPLTPDVPGLATKSPPHRDRRIAGSARVSSLEALGFIRKCEFSDVSY